ncbi:MAG: GNAT family N-acetyltransferase [Paracoccaceae bacterium]
MTDTTFAITDLRAATPEAMDALLRLNNAHAVETSELTAAQLGRMVQGAFAAWGVAGAGALLLAFDEGAPHDSPNFEWFRARHPRFVYVDRIIVGAGLRGRGVARALYEALFARAAEKGRPFVACEVNAHPPNPGSDAFHAALGFEVVGQGSPSPGKTVRYMRKRLDGPA